MDSIFLAEDRDRLVAVVNTFGFHKMQGIYWIVEDLLASQEGVWFMNSLGMEFHSMWYFHQNLGLLPKSWCTGTKYWRDCTQRQNSQHSYSYILIPLLKRLITGTILVKGNLQGQSLVSIDTQ